MGQTDRWDIRYPEQGDEVDVPTDMAELAADVEAAVGRAFVCTSSTRPTGVPRGFLIDETDTGDTRKYSGSGTTWTLVGGSSGGGGGSAVSGLWRAASAQSIPNTASGPGTPVAFGTETSASAEVTRVVFGAGHTFELGASGLWTGVFIGRWATTITAGVRDFNVWCDRAGGAFEPTETLAHDGGGTVAGQPKGRTLSFARVLPAGTLLAVYAYNGTGATRTLEHSSGDWVALDLHYLG